MSILLRYADTRFSAELEKAETFTSLSTGAELKRLTISFQADDQSKALIETILAGSSALESPGSEGQPSGRWKPRQLGYSYRDGSPVTTYRWELLQEEIISIEVLNLGDLVIVPYEYRESFDDENRLTVDARARLDLEQLRQLRALPVYFSVVRTGINNTPREMRFGRLLWSDHTQYVKQEIFLVDRALDDEKAAALFQPEMYHFKTRISENRGLIGGILDALKTKGVLDDAGIEQIKEQALSGIDSHLPEFTRVDDLDAWKERNL